MKTLILAALLALLVGCAPAKPADTYYLVIVDTQGSAVFPERDYTACAGSRDSLLIRPDPKRVLIECIPVDTTDQAHERERRASG